MSQVKVVAFDFIRQEHLDEWYKLAKKFIRDTHEKDQGCIEFSMFVDDKEKNRFCYTETWASLQAMEDHMAKQHFKDFAARRAEINIKPTEWTTYTLVEA